MTLSSTQRERLVQASEAAFGNAGALLDDAKFLRGDGRFARAKALAMLAEEELAKALTLCVCGSGNRWDANVRKALKHHPPKQGIAHAARKWFSWMERNAAMIAELNRHATIPGHIPAGPSADQMASFLKEGQSITDDGAQDREKQDALYVRVDRIGDVIADPASVTSDEADRWIDNAEVVRRFVELIKNVTA